MKRRTFFGAIPAAVAAAFAVALATPRSVFAKHVRPSLRKWNGNGQPHIERATRAVMPYTMLEDAEAFHAQAEEVRLAMIELLRREGAPINVWRVGQMNGVTEQDMTTFYEYDGTQAEGGGPTRVYKDAHHFYIRTRTSVERPPFTYTHEVQ